MTDPSAPWSLETLRANEAWLRPLVRSLVDDATADDVLQDTWLQAWRRPPRGHGGLRTWLATVATNFARSRRRDERRRQRHEHSAAAPLGSDVESTAQLVERLTLHRAISAAVLDLPEPFRDVVLLHHCHGLDATAIATRIATTPANVRQRLHRGHRWLRARLDAENGPRWRRSPAVLALLAPTASPTPPTPLAALTPALLAMNKLRFAITTLVVASLIGGALLVPRWLEAPERTPSGDSPPALASAASSAGAARMDAGTPVPESPVAADRVPAGIAAERALAGSVVDTRGRPVGGVRVGVRGAADRPATDLALTDPGGGFTIVGPWPEAGVDALDPWVALAVRPPQGDRAQPALLVVAPCRSQALRVIDPRGAPLSGAHVEVDNRALVDFPGVLDQAQEMRLGDATTDADGRAVWPCVPLLATTFAISCRGFAPRFFAVDASMPAELLVTLQPLRKGARVISGVVTDARGAWVAGASVALRNRRTTADAYGHFAIELAPGEQVRDDEPLHAHAPSWYPAIVRRFGARLNTESEAALQQDLVLQPLLTIAGQVLDDRGEPCAGVLVYPWQLDLLTDEASAEDLAMPADAATLSLGGNPIRAFTRTDDAGRFLLSGLGATDYRLRVHDDRAMWGYTSPPIAGGSSAVTIRLPTPPMGPVAGRVTTREGAPAAGVRLRGYVEVLLNGGGMVGSSVPVSAQTDAEGRFRVERMPRLGLQLGFTGEEWIDHSIDLAEQADPEALQVTVLRRCHVRVECTGAAWSDARVEFRDANDAVLLITERRRSTVTSLDSVELHRGKTGVFALSEAATTMVLRTADGKREQRVPVVPRPGEVTAFVHHLD